MTTNIAPARPGQNGRRGRWKLPGSAERYAGPLILVVYLAAAVVVNWRLLAAVRTAKPLGDTADNDQFAWYLGYAAHAVAHGHLPSLFTTALNAPRGVNLMWNTPVLFPGVVLSPVTAWLGPQAGLDVMLVLGYAGSAAAMFWLLRRTGAGLGAAGLGGAVFGFSPALVNSAPGHYDLQFAVFAPLIIEAVVAIVTGRGRPVRYGIWLGLLVSAQLFTEEETLVDLVLACVLLVIVLAVSRSVRVRERLRGTAIGLGVTAVTAVLLCGRALWVEFLGPLVSHGSPYPNSKFGNTLSSFVTAPGDMLLHTTSGAAYASHYPTGMQEYVAYLGWPLLIVLLAAGACCWRDLRVRAAFIIWAVLELISLGGGSVLLPFHWLQNLPLLTEMLPDRVSLYADGAAAATLAYAIDYARSASWTWAPERWKRVAPLAIAVLAVVPLIPRPTGTNEASQVPAGWNAIYARLHLSSQARVLVVPVPYAKASQAMRWQADSGLPGQQVAGWFLGVNAKGQAVTRYWGPPPAEQAVLCLDAQWRGTSVPGCEEDVRTALKYWRPDAILANVRPDSREAQLISQVLGHSPTQAGSMLGWKAG